MKLINIRNHPHARSLASVYKMMFVVVYFLLLTIQLLASFANIVGKQWSLVLPPRPTCESPHPDLDKCLGPGVDFSTNVEDGHHPRHWWKKD